MEEVNCASNSLTSIESQTKIGQKQTGDLAESLTMNVLSSHFVPPVLCHLVKVQQYPIEVIVELGIKITMTIVMG